MTKMKRGLAHAVHTHGDTEKKQRVEVSIPEWKCTPIDAASIEAFRAHGYVVLPSQLSPQEVEYLRTECDALFAALDADPVKATEIVIEQGCVVDVMASYPMADHAQARVDKQSYLKARAQQINSGHQGDHTGTLDRLLFNRLPTLAAQLLPDSAAPVYFFNEHYVVKPPATAVEFRWHRDDDEQLAMCVHRDSIPPYLSAWCALDDVTEAMGPLRFVPLNADVDGDGDDDESELRQRASPPVCVAAGSVVWFWSNIWHCSSANASPKTRRAFYAQYSHERITARPSDATPLSFAIPCVATEPQ